MAKLLTDRSVAQARAKDGKRTEFADSISPLRLVVQPSGAKSWATRFRLHGHPHSRERSQTATISRLEGDGYSGRMRQNSHRSSLSGIPSGIQMSELIH